MHKDRRAGRGFGSHPSLSTRLNWFPVVVNFNLHHMLEAVDFDSDGASTFRAGDVHAPSRKKRNCIVMLADFRTVGLHCRALLCTTKAGRSHRRLQWTFDGHSKSNEQHAPSHDSFPGLVVSHAGATLGATSCRGSRPLNTVYVCWACTAASLASRGRRSGHALGSMSTANVIGECNQGSKAAQRIDSGDEIDHGMLRLL